MNFNWQNKKNITLFQFLLKKVITSKIFHE